MKDTLISFGPLNIPAYVIGGENNPKKILYLHGYNTSRERQIAICERINEATGRTVILPEYSGHGVSKLELDQTTPALHGLEALTVYDWLKKTSDETNICVYGGSYGSYLAAQLCKYRSPGHLILQAPSILFPNDFYTPWKVLKTRNKVCQQLPFEDLIALNHPLLTRLAEMFSGKITILEMENDTDVPHDTSQTWRHFLPEARYCLIKDALHSIIKSSEKAQNDFVDEIKVSLEL